MRKLQAVVIVPSLIMLLFFLVPLGAIFVNLDLMLFLAKLAQPIVYEALWLSIVTSLASMILAVFLGTPLAYLLARGDFKGKAYLESLMDLPMVLPPAVAGVALLLTFGRNGLLGSYLPWSIPFSTGAVIIAQTFVAAPFFVRSAVNSFAMVDTNLEKASLTLGVDPWRTFWRVTMPLSFPGLLGGAVMSWARALGEFGATIMFAGNLQGVTRTLPLAIYTAMESDLQAAMVIAGLMIMFSLLVLILTRRVLRLSRGVAKCLR